MDRNWNSGREEYLAELVYGMTLMENTFFKIEPQALYNDQICFINLISSFLFSLQVFLP